MISTSLRAAIALTGTLSVAGLQATTLYSNDFETTIAGVTGAGFSAGTGGYAGLGFGSTFFRNWETGNPAAATVVSFSAPGPAAGAMLSFDLAVIDSWDGSALLGGCCNDDVFTVKLDGATVFTAEFNNTWSFVPGFAGSDTQTFPRDGRMLAGPVTNLAGEWNGSSGYDSAYRLTLALGTLGAGAHTLEFYAGGPGWQGGTDESFAIDNVSVNAVPVPGAVVLMGSALSGLLGRRRRRAI